MRVQLQQRTLDHDRGRTTTLHDTIRNREIRNHKRTNLDVYSPDSQAALGGIERPSANAEGTCAIKNFKHTYTMRTVILYGACMRK